MIKYNNLPVIVPPLYTLNKEKLETYSSDLENQLLELRGLMETRVLMMPNVVRRDWLGVNKSV